MKLKKLLLRVLLVLLTWTIVAALAARALVVSVPLAHADAIVVLSGSRAYKERTAYAAALYKQGVASTVILTNDGEQGSWSNAEERNPYFHELAARELEQQGVPATSIKLLPTKVEGTGDEALAVRDYCSQNGVKTILLVTSAYHTRRAFWIFEHVVGKHGVQLGVQSPKSPAKLMFFWWLRPYGWKTVGAEYVKMVYYYFA